MTSELPALLTPRMEAATDAMKQLVLERFPEATFDQGPGEDPVGIYLIATVDLGI